MKEFAETFYWSVLIVIVGLPIPILGQFIGRYLGYMTILNVIVAVSVVVVALQSNHITMDNILLDFLVTMVALYLWEAIGAASVKAIRRAIQQ